MYAQDMLRQEGRNSLKLAYANEFTDAFSSYGDEMAELAGKPSVLQKACKKTIEDCTDANGVINKSANEIKETAGKYIKEAAKEAPTALSGEWIKVNEHMSEYSRAYQTQITGHAGEVWYQNGVKFDGMKDGVLKGKYSQFINKETGEFYEWFNGKKELEKEALRQIGASEGAPICWYFAEEDAMKIVEKYFDDNYNQISFEFIPKI